MGRLGWQEVVRKCKYCCVTTRGEAFPFMISSVLHLHLPYLAEFPQIDPDERHSLV